MALGGWRRDRSRASACVQSCVDNAGARETPSASKRIAWVSDNKVRPLMSVMPCALVRLVQRLRRRSAVTNFLHSSPCLASACTCCTLQGRRRREVPWSKAGVLKDGRGACVGGDRLRRETARHGRSETDRKRETDDEIQHWGYRTGGAEEGRRADGEEEGRGGGGGGG